MADFVHNGSIVVPASTVAAHLQLLESAGFITNVQAINPIQVVEQRYSDYCRHLNAQLGEEDAFGYHHMSTQVGAFIAIHRNDRQSSSAAKEAIDTASQERADAEGVARDWGRS